MKGSGDTPHPNNKTTKAMNSIYALRWKTVQRHIDIETGELLDPKEAVINYYVIRTKKSKDVNKKKSQGIVTITYECRRFNQLAIW